MSKSISKSLNKLERQSFYMQEESEVTISFSSELTPIHSENGDAFLNKIQQFTDQLYEKRQTKVATEEPLLSSEDQPLYEQSNLDSDIAYSIDIRNIHKWLRYFTNETQAPPQTIETITFDVPPENYDHLGDVLFIQSDQEIALTFSEEPPVDLNELDTLLTLKYTPNTNTLELSFEEERSFPSTGQTTEVDITEEKRFSTFYDHYHSYLDADGVEQHEAFAIFSPATDYKQVTEHIQSMTTRGSMVVVTNDDWKVCAVSPDDKDYEVDVSLVEFLSPVSDRVEEYYEEFPYSTKYIHLPELQYLSTVSNAYLSNDEKQLLRTLPYAVPFGDNSALEDKLLHAQKFTSEDVPDELFDVLQCTQFVQQSV